MVTSVPSYKAAGALEERDNSPAVGSVQAGAGRTTLIAAIATDEPARVM